MAVSFDLLQRPTIGGLLVGGLIGINPIGRRDVYDSTQQHLQGAPDRLAIMDILISIAKWLALSAGGLILFGALLVGLLAWLLNRPLD